MIYLAYVVASIIAILIISIAVIILAQSKELLMFVCTFAATALIVSGAVCSINYIANYHSKPPKK